MSTESSVLMLHWDVSSFGTFALPQQVQKHHCSRIHESCSNFGSTAVPFAEGYQPQDHVCDYLCS